MAATAVVMPVMPEVSWTASSILSLSASTESANVSRDSWISAPDSASGAPQRPHVADELVGRGVRVARCLLDGVGGERRGISDAVSDLFELVGPRGYG